MSFHKNNTQTEVLTRPDDLETSKANAAPCPELSPAEFNRAWWCLLYLNMAVMWAYFTLLSAQDVYIALYPDANIGFLGIMLTGIAMASGQFVSMLCNLDAYGGFDLRVQGAFLAFAVLAVFVMAVQRAETILAAWALTGLINTLSESKLYTLAAIGASDGKLTNAVQLGNGCAGLTNILTATFIRILVLTAMGGWGDNVDPEKADEANKLRERVSFYFALGLLLVMSLVAIPVYRYLVNMSGFKMRIAAFRHDDTTDATQTFGSRVSHLGKVLGSIWGAVFTQFLCFFVSLSAFPAVPCSVPLTGSVFSPAWYCSPGIIGSFNGGDWLGRILCTLPIMGRVFAGSLRLNGLGLARVLILGIIMFCALGRAGQEAPVLPWIVLIVMVVFSITNGVVSTLSMMRAPLLVEDKDREVATQIMVLALYCGIASGTILAAILNQTGLLG